MIDNNLKNISFSQFSMYLDCPYKWYLAYVKNMRTGEGSIHTIFGTAIHYTLQYFLEIMYNDSVKNANELDLDIIFKNKFKELFVEFKTKYNKNVCDKDTLIEFYLDGVEILKYFKKNRDKYFKKPNNKLIGVELKLNTPLFNKVNWLGFIDIAIIDTDTNIVRIIDLKTSTKGWKDYQKKSITKTSQLVLYKKFYSEIFKYDIDNIEVEFIILKRKLYEDCDFPQSRIQVFSPSSGKMTQKRVSEILKKFIDTCFEDNGEYNSSTIYSKNINEFTCKYCEFNSNNQCLK